MGLFDHLKFVAGMKTENALQKAEENAMRKQTGNE
jgi:hypothetical protein